MMKPDIIIYTTATELAEKFAEEVTRMISKKESTGHPFTLALAGGSTPELLYSVLGDQYSDAVNWNSVHFFWGDERCVPPESSDSNFGMTDRALLSKLNVPERNIHRIMGENDPYPESVRYSKEIEAFTRNVNGLPCFDLILLGLGEDGHTASIFPSASHLLNSVKTCEVAMHPVTQQKRITLTGKVINNAKLITFLVTGVKKAEIVASIINKQKSAVNFPASAIVPSEGSLIWCLDKEAAMHLKE